MTTEKAGKVWATLVIVFGLFYAFSALSSIYNILNSFGIPWATEMFVVAFIIMTMLLIVYTYNNPHIIFVALADQKRVLMTKRFWDDIKNYPEDKLDLLEEEIHNMLHNIQYNISPNNQIEHEDDEPATPHF